MYFVTTEIVITIKLVQVMYVYVHVHMLVDVNKDVRIMQILLMLILLISAPLTEFKSIAILVSVCILKYIPWHTGACDLTSHFIYPCSVKQLRLLGIS